MKNLRTIDEFLKEEFNPNQEINKEKDAWMLYHKRRNIERLKNIGYKEEELNNKSVDEVSALVKRHEQNGRLAKDNRSQNKPYAQGELKENILPRQCPKTRCLECGEEVCDSTNYKIGHLYNKHNCKPSVGDYKAKAMLKKYFA